MNKKIKAKWIKVLPSGKYVQGNRCLRRNDRFCCLGVLCDLLQPEEWVPLLDGFFLMDGEQELLPDSIARTAKIRAADQRKLIVMNDEGQSFAEIAGWIEKNL